MQTKANGRSAFIVITAGLLALTTMPARACNTSDCGRILLAQNADPQGQQEQQVQPDAAAAPEPAVETSKASKKKSRHTKASSGSEKAAEKSNKLASKTTVSEKKSPDKMFGADKTADQGDRASSKVEPGKSEAAKSETAKSETAKSDDNKPNATPWANANAQMGARPTGAAATTVTDSPRPVTTMAVRVTPQAATANPALTTEDDAQVIASDQLNELDRAAETDQKPASKTLRPTSQTVQTASASSDDAWSQTSLIGKIFIGFGGLLTLASAARMFIA
ncbi:hypothetical protein [Bradyrhizobium prioriisuperbiae]|uniref:hypothetical protein n=1 Tax=Bradyrhizobium prioriisuperbiae TaxID=2854389 RepID=UPI0028E73AB3|nr:hypothetical protein [Bradyrhizobium prioritasuperba]